MDDTTLLFLQGLLLITDGVGAVGSFAIAQYYRGGKQSDAVRIPYGFFRMLAWVFLALALSDWLVISKFPRSWWVVYWATLPIVWGLVFRVPITIYQIKMMRAYGRL